MAALRNSDIPPDAPYHINLTYVARHRIAATEKFNGNPKSFVSHVALPFTNSRTVEDILREVDEEQARLDEYIGKRLWKATTAELNERIAAKISAAEETD